MNENFYKELVHDLLIGIDSIRTLNELGVLDDEEKIIHKAILLDLIETRIIENNLDEITIFKIGGNNN